MHPRASAEPSTTSEGDLVCGHRVLRRRKPVFLPQLFLSPASLHHATKYNPLLGNLQLRDEMAEEGTYYTGPYTRLDLCVFTLIEGALHVLLAKRERPPYRGMWALPGGALQFQVDPSLEQGLTRVVRERLGCLIQQPKQQCALGGYDRHEAGKWCLSIVYRALVRPEHLAPTHGKRISEFDWRPIKLAVADRQLASDHMQLIAQCVASLREEVQRLDLPVGYLPSTFTLTQLQSQCEHLLDRRLDKSSFRRRLADRDLVEATGEVQQSATHRPAQLYRIKPRA